MPSERGAAQSKLCPRQGHVVMKLAKGGDLVVPVNCGTWGCLSCRDRNWNRIKSMIRYGISILGPTYLITVTLRMEELADSKDAKYVAAMWKAFISRLKVRNPNLSWFRIIELTKQSQPHLHLVVGGLGTRNARCLGKRHKWSQEWVEKGCRRKDCLEHEWSREWLTVTGESFIVQVMDVAGAAGAASYLAKYLTKGVHQREELEALGFVRRWSCSANWPRTKVAVRAIEDGYVETTKYVGAGSPGSLVAAQDAADDVGHPLLQLTGDRVLLDDIEKRNRKRLIGIFGGALNANNRTQNVDETSR